MIDAERQPLRAVEDEDELVAAGIVDPTHVPLQLWAGAEALAGFKPSGTREVFWAATGGRRRSIICAGRWSATARRGLSLRRTGLTRAARTLF